MSNPLDARGPEARNGAGKITIGNDEPFFRGTPKPTKPTLPPWTPFQRVVVSTLPEWAATAKAAAAPEGSSEQRYENSRYFVCVTRIPAKQGSCGNDLIHLSIRSTDRDARHDWRDFQRIKNELVGVEEEAIELYPAESRLVDGTNQFHLWCIPGMLWPFGFGERLVSSATLPGTKQRPFEEPPADCITDADELLRIAREGKK